MDGYLLAELPRVEEVVSDNTNSNHPEGEDDFVFHYDASGQGLGAVLMQHGRVIAYASH